MPSPHRIAQELAKAAGITVPYYKVEVLTENSVRFHLYGGRIVTYVAPNVGDKTAQGAGVFDPQNLGDKIDDLSLIHI